MNNCKTCKNEYDLDQVIRSSGKISSVVTGGFCSARCYTISINEVKPLTDRDQNTLVVLKEVLDKMETLIFNQDNKELIHEVIMIDSLIKKTLETFKD